MPASGALGPFLSSMMELRSQRLREQEAKEQAMADMGKSIAGGISSLGEGLTKGMEKSRLDEMAKSLGVPGGVDEITLRKAMGQYDASRGNDYYKQASFDLRMAAEERAARGEKVAEEQRTAQANRLLSEDSKKDMNDALGFELQTKDILAKMSDPKISAREHSDLASKVRSIRTTAEKRKLPMAEFTIPTYVSAEDQAALKARDEAQARMMAQPIQRGWGAPSTVPGAQQFRNAQAAVEGSTTMPRQTQIGPGGIPMSGQMPLGETVPGYTPPPQEQAQPQAQPQGQGGPVPGATYRNPTTGERRKYLGNGQWQTLK